MAACMAAESGYGLATAQDGARRVRVEQKGQGSTAFHCSLLLCNSGSSGPLLGSLFCFLGHAGGLGKRTMRQRAAASKVASQTRKENDKIED